MTTISPIKYEVEIHEPLLTRVRTAISARTRVNNGSWISTSYLIGEIVVIPLTDYLSRLPPLHAGQRDPVCDLLRRLRLHPRSAVHDRNARRAGICRRCR